MPRRSSGNAVTSGLISNAGSISRPAESTTDTLTGPTELAGIVPMVLRVISQTFGSHTAGFFVRGDDGRIALRYCLLDNRVMTASEFITAEIGVAEVRERLTRGFTLADTYYGTPARQRARAVVLDQSAGSGESELDSRARKFACALELNVPLVVASDVIGALTVYRGATSSFTDAEVALAEALARLLALAVEGARLAEIARDRAVEGAVSRERERAAVERAAVLAKANEALRKGTARIAMDGGEIINMLDAFLLEAVSATGAGFGGVARRIGNAGSGCVTNSVARDGFLTHFPNCDALETAFGVGRTTDPLGIMRRTLDGEAFVFPITDLEHWRPGCYALHRDGGFRTIGHFPLQVGGAVTGYLTLSWREHGAPDTLAFETARVLALQASLALETQRLGDEARATAIAAERQAASNAVAEERTRLAREMHDTLAQALAGVVMQLGAARERLGDAYTTAAPHLDLVDRLARDALAVARRAIAALRPEGSAAEGLEMGLRRLMAEAESGPKSSARFVFTVTGTVRQAPPEIEFELLRIVQASLANAVQHANAGTIVVTLAFKAIPALYGAVHDPLLQCVPTIRLTVTDDGIGFDSATIRPGHFGLLGMRERAARIGAALTLVTGPGEGTEIVVVWPGLGGSESTAGS